MVSAHPVPSPARLLSVAKTQSVGGRPIPHEHLEFKMRLLNPRNGGAQPSQTGVKLISSHNDLIGLRWLHKSFKHRDRRFYLGLGSRARVAKLKQLSQIVTFVAFFVRRKVSFLIFVIRDRSPDSLHDETNSLRSDARAASERRPHRGCFAPRP